MSTSQSILALRQSTLPGTTVRASGYFYLVDFGEGVRPQHHSVGKNAVCSCPLGGQCPAVEAVRAYLRAGGERTATPPPGYYPAIPHQCPICGAGVTFDSHLSSRNRGAGWRCVAGGSAHYWKRLGQVLAEKFAANPWLFPPVVVRDGQQINAWDGVRPEDRVLAAGLLRADVGTPVR